MPDFLRSQGPKVAVGGLVVVNALLIGALMMRQPAYTTVPQPQAPNTTSQPSPTSSPTSSTTPSPSSASPTPAETPSAAAPPESPDRPRLLAANSGTTAWRAEPGDCSKLSRVEVTTDGGRTWSRKDPGLRSVVRMKAFGVDSVFVVGADARCRPSYAWTIGPRQPWSRDRTEVTDKWFRLPARLDLVHAPGGRVTQPCGTDLVDLAGLGTYRAAALCGDGRVRTINQNRDWRTVARSSGVVAVNADDDEFVAASARRDCAGIGLQRFSTNGNGVGKLDAGCRKGTAPQTGQTAISLRYGTAWVWNGTSVTTR